MEEGRKVYHAGYYMTEVADTWYMEYIEGKENIDWPEFCRLLMQRFVNPGKEDVVIEFTKLQQNGDVKSYQEKFDELKSLVKVKNPDLSEEFLTSCFLRGLKEELRIPVQLFKPTELNQAINMAKMLESTLDIWGRKNKWGNNKTPYSGMSKPAGNFTLPKKEEKKENTEGSISYKKISDAQYQKRRALGLCFHCDEKYSYGHVCKNKQFNLIVIEDGEDTNEEEQEIEESIEEIQGGISINALMGSKSNTTLKITGNRGRKN